MNEAVYLGSMFNRDVRYEIDVERRITTDNRVNKALPVLIRRQNISTGAFGRTMCSVGTLR